MTPIKKRKNSFNDNLGFLNNREVSSQPSLAIMSEQVINNKFSGQKVPSAIVKQKPSNVPFKMPHPSEIFDIEAIKQNELMYQPKV